MAWDVETEPEYQKRGAGEGSAKILAHLGTAYELRHPVVARPVSQYKGTT